DFGYEEDVVEALKEDFDMANPEVFEYGMSGGFGSMFGLKMNSFFGNSIENQLLSKALSDYNSPRMMYLYGEK
ncbi:MAG TPA: signal peptide peptidase SppA, partial [Planococcus sp. (in: firmicutes)]|nr:signal peptide peptidase SppA [Planococcus sp. (in: firmicutes)]